MADKKDKLTPRQRLLQAIEKRGIDNLTAEEQALFQKEYGQAYALIMLDPELRRKAITGIRQNWTPDRFVVEFRNTKWMRDKLAAAERTATFEVSDPVEFNAALNRLKDEMRRAAIAAAGSEAAAQIDDAILTRDARTLMDKYYDGRIESVFPYVQRFARNAYVGNSALKFGGEAATRATEIRNYARQMGIQVNDTEVGNYVDGIFAETDTLENVQEKIRQQALGFYPQFADRIKAGATVEEIAFPYRRMLADMLEMDTENVNIIGDKASIDPLMARALYATDVKWNAKTMGLWEFRKAIKQDERWQYTRNAQEEYASMARELMRMFGAGV